MVASLADDLSVSVEVDGTSRSSDKLHSAGCRVLRLLLLWATSRDRVACRMWF